MRRIRYGRKATGSTGPVGVSRRALLVGLLLTPPVLVGCGPEVPEQAAAPDPLITLADAARADVALVTAVLAATPALTDRLGPVRDARAQHAAALDTEVRRLDPTGVRPTAGSGAPIPPAGADPDAPTPSAAPSGTAAAPSAATAPVVTLATVRTALSTSGGAAAAAALTLPMGRAGLVGSVAACCTTYAAVLA